MIVHVSYDYETYQYCFIMKWKIIFITQQITLSDYACCCCIQIAIYAKEIPKPTQFEATVYNRYVGTASQTSRYKFLATIWIRE